MRQQSVDGVSESLKLVKIVATFQKVRFDLYCEVTKVLMKMILLNHINLIFLQ